MKILKTSLKEMLQTGQIADLKPGLSREQVREIMGNPETWSVIGKNRSMENAAIWKYGLLEYSFGVSYIALEVHSADSFPQNIKLEGFFPNAATSLQEFEDFLTSNQLQVLIDHSLTFGAQKTLLVGKNSIGFMDNRIHSIFLR